LLVRLDNTLIDPTGEAKIVTIDNGKAAARSGEARIWGHFDFGFWILDFGFSQEDESGDLQPLLSSVIKSLIRGNLEVKYNPP